MVANDISIDDVHQRFGHFPMTEADRTEWLADFGLRPAPGRRGVYFDEVLTRAVQAGLVTRKGKLKAILTYCGAGVKGGYVNGVEWLPDANPT